jgi:hypothetical protein
MIIKIETAGFSQSESVGVASKGIIQMTNVASIKMLLADIVRSQCPEEWEAFDLEGDQLINEAINNQTFETPDTSFDRKFGADEILQVVQFTGIVIGTIKTLRDLGVFGSSKQKILNANELGTTWRDHLQQSGMSEEKAHEIDSQYRRRLLNLSRSD